MSLPMLSVVEHSEICQAYRDEIQELHETNRIILDVFWSASGIIKNCCLEGNCEQSYEMLRSLLKSVEAEFKENAE